MPNWSSVLPVTVLYASVELMTTILFTAICDPPANLDRFRASCPGGSIARRGHSGDATRGLAPQAGDLQRGELPADRPRRMP